jgi:hypothetical protein
MISAGDQENEGQVQQQGKYAVLMDRSCQNMIFLQPRWAQ